MENYFIDIELNEFSKKFCSGCGNSRTREYCEETQPARLNPIESWLKTKTIDFQFQVHVTKKIQQKKISEL
jgi:hypothetical protein